MRGEKSRRNAHTPTQSCAIMIGNRIAAARTGEMTIANNGIARVLMPENPPFDRPIENHRSRGRAVEREIGRHLWIAFA